MTVFVTVQLHLHIGYNLKNETSIYGQNPITEADKKLHTQLQSCPHIAGHTASGVCEVCVCFSVSVCVLGR